MSNEVNQGTVKWFDSTKGFGFLAPIGEASKDVFVHISSVLDGKKLNEDDKVEFAVETSPKGLNAINVRVLD